MEKLLKSIIWNPEKLELRIGEKTFKISDKIAPIIGTKKIAYLLENETEFIKVVKNSNPDTQEIFQAMQLTFDGQEILKQYQIPTPKILEFDPAGPPFRYFIQEAVPSRSISAAELIKAGLLTENDIKHIAEIVNKFELEEKWQIDTNPFNWYRSNDQMTYVDGKVYSYSSDWEFKKVGLLQWTNPKFILNAVNKSAAIPSQNEQEEFAKSWTVSTNQQILLWKKYLDITLQP